MATKIRLRRGTASEWTSANPTLESGEVGVETDTNKFKIGNGSTAWNSLVYAANNQNQNNIIINGDFSVWQRGTSAITTSAYRADRWYFAINAGSGSFQQSTAAPLPSVAGSRYFGRCTASANSSNLALLQAIEQAVVIPLRGQQLTVSAYVRGSYSGNLNIGVNYSSSTDALSSQNTLISDTSPTISSSWQRVSLTFTVPSDAVGLRVSIGSKDLQMTSGSTLDIWGAKLEIGSSPTPFDFEPYETTLRKCQRYYYLYAVGDQSISSGFLYTSTYIMTVLHFPTTMRIAPSLEFTTGTGFYQYYTGALVDVNGTGFFLQSASPNSAWLFNNSVSGGTAGNGIVLRTNTNGGRIALAAEL